MKRITAIIIVTAAVIGSSYVGAASATEQSPCAHIAEASASYIGANPSHPMYKSITSALIESCVEGASAYAGGMTQEFAEAMVNDSVKRTIKLKGEQARVGAEAFSMAYLGGFTLAQQKDLAK